MSQAQRVRCYMNAARIEAIGWLGWTEEQYWNFLFETGCRYLELYFPFADDREVMGRSKAFWGWWRLHWYMRDREWMSLLNADYMKFKCWKVAWRYTPEQARYEYRQLHDPQKLADGLGIDGEVLEESYARDLGPSLR